MISRRPLISLVSLLLSAYIGLTDASAALPPASIKNQVNRKNPIFAPVAIRPGAEDYFLQLRLIQHGARFSPDVWKRQVLDLEKIYSQCKGVNFHVQVATELNAPYTTDQDNLSEEVPGQGVRMGAAFFRFFQPGLAGRDPHILDVHVVDHLSEEGRREYRKNKTVSTLILGQSFNSHSIDALYSGAVSAVGGDTVILAEETLQGFEGKTGYFPTGKKDSRGEPIYRKYLSYDSSLLAHEVGHVVMDEQNGTGYRDHFCPGIGNDCPEDNFMTAGGFDDRVWPDGYSGLPEIEEAQCEIMKRSQFVRRTCFFNIPSQSFSCTP